MFSGDFAAKPVGSFAQAFSKACQSRRDRRSRLARRETPYRSKAPPKGECQAEAWQRGTAQVGGSPFETKANLRMMPAFFFGSRGAKKKAWQKRTRR